MFKVTQVISDKPVLKLYKGNCEEEGLINGLVDGYLSLLAKSNSGAYGSSKLSTISKAFDDLIAYCKANTPNVLVLKDNKEIPLVSRD